MNWVRDYDRAAPPLPPRLRSLRLPFTTRGAMPTGCYLARLEPIVISSAETPFPRDVVFQGTLRVEHHERTMRRTFQASMDLYARNLGAGDPALFRPKPHPEEADFRAFASALATEGKIPVYPRADYRYYASATALSRAIDPRAHPRDRSAGTTPCQALGLEMFRFEPTSSLDGAGERSAHPNWRSQGLLTAFLPEAREHLDSERRHPVWLQLAVRNNLGTDVATLSLALIHRRFLRSITVELAQVADFGLPTDNARWQRALENAQVEVSVEPIATPVAVPASIAASGVWTPPDLERYLDQRPHKPDLDQSWTYNLLGVQRLERVPGHGARGLLYDFAPWDQNHTAREGAAIASGSSADGLPEDGRLGSSESLGRRLLRDLPRTHLRIAVHELGHCMGLLHDPEHRGAMQPFENALKRPGARRRFPTLADTQPSEPDAQRLKHFPDPWIRPGGLPFAHLRSRSPLDPHELTQETRQVKLSVAPITVSLGQPRTTLQLTFENRSQHRLYVPGRSFLTSTPPPFSLRLVTPAGDLVTVVPSQVPESVVIGRALLTPSRTLVVAVPVSVPANWPGLYEAQVVVAWVDKSGAKRVEATTTLTVA